MVESHLRLFQKVYRMLAENQVTHVTISKDLAYNFMEFLTEHRIMWWLHSSREPGGVRYSTHDEAITFWVERNFET